MLRLDRLSRRYGNTCALDELSFEVGKGEVVGFLGPNGAGKTTAMRAVLGIVQLDSGSVRWNGSPVDLDTRMRFGYMPEERGLFAASKIRDQLVFLARLHGLKRSKAEESAMRVLDTLGVGERALDRLDSLSLGNQQRVQMAAALVHDPELLVLDEPFSGLDPNGVESLSAVLSERAKNGAAVVFSSHQLDLVEHLCERVVIINNGSLVVSGKTKDLTTSENTLSVAVDGDSEGNWARSIDGAEFQSFNRGTVRLTIAERNVSGRVLDAARRAGNVSHFTFDHKRLSEVFRDAVNK